jgi:hypothetical protein
MPSDAPGDWTDADAATLPVRWRDAEESAEGCQRCGTDTRADARLCERCDQQVRLGR